MHVEHSVHAPPFGPLSAYIHRRISDDATYIESLRKTLVWWDRWRWLGIVTHVGILVALVYLGDEFLSFIRGMQAMFPGANPNVDAVILAGACAGLTFGLMLQGSVWAIITAVSGLRTERLLVEYYDRQRVQDSCGSTDRHLDTQTVPSLIRH